MKKFLRNAFNKIRTCFYNLLFKILFPAWPYQPDEYRKMSRSRYRLMHQLITRTSWFI
jgi:hypothetical protein